MNKQVNISKEKVRQLRMSKGWPQEQLALASGLSVRTVQRVESEGAASLNTAMSLAATFEVDVSELQQTYQLETSRKQKLQYGLFIGLVILTLSLATQPLPLPDDPYSTYMRFMSYFLAGLGILIMIPNVISAFKHKQFFALALASIGAPLTTILLVGVFYLLLGLGKPKWELFALGLGGACILFKSLKKFNKSK
ncbi:helix-turn-helix domain-containing protein [Pseudoalteromonas phenolica]|uniref:HTH cro/C1-type domain-containing protein n=2 Tax=Pseudoalteromonas phenolica TaxID=161398 RepID=A0A0S2K055_9GAMM|nr:helix-turn-helix transcriptional regulator [Pseudoalteromonas phenolica]ALO41654.1 hypothetical protein PP2015_1138 [Pseudoalteromonas phenolica]MBE0353796.1 hypothetical protein [Pseudoalteromonas phenolica O-BC30]